MRIITCGGVNVGKSTLLDRLLCGVQAISSDRLPALDADPPCVDIRNCEAELSVLFHGLIPDHVEDQTIETAYRYFTTDTRSFFVAEAPCYDQYPRNFVAEASTAHLAMMIVDACSGVLEQTRRHFYLSSLLGIKTVLVLINKMDLVNYELSAFTAINSECAKFISTLDFDEIVSIPVSALKGDNIFYRSSNTSWYTGSTVMGYLETVSIRNDRKEKPFRMSVQSISGPGAPSQRVAGTIATGSVRAGDSVFAPSIGHLFTVDRILSPDEEKVDQAIAGQSISLSFTEEKGISRGELLSSPQTRPTTADQFEAAIIWMHKDPLLPGRMYQLQAGHQTVPAQVSELKYKINVNTLEHVATKILKLHEIGICNVALHGPISFDPYRENQETGSFILIDEHFNTAIAAGMIHFALWRAENIHWQAVDIHKEARAVLKGQKPFILWFTGLSGAGKSSIANLVEKKLHSLGQHTYLLDGDNVRHGLNRDLGFTDADRVENIRRVAETAKLMVDAGLIVLVSFISPFKSEREMARQLVEQGEFLEVFVDTPLEICEQRDVKGLYKKARGGKLKNFTGIDSPYERPEKAEIRIEGDVQTPEEAALFIVQTLKAQGLLTDR